MPQKQNRVSVAFLQALCCFLSIYLFTLIAPSDGIALPLNKIKLPPGFKIELYAKVDHARQMALSSSGTLFVGTRDMKGSVYAVVDGDHDSKADTIYTVASNLFMPNGVAFRNGSLYVAEVNRILRFDNIENSLSQPAKPVVISDKFPSDTHHGWKYIKFGPDDLLYVPVGAPCNVCVRKDNPQYASMTRVKPDGTGAEIFAKGIRNTVGFDWDPRTKELWFSDNGRDLLGDDIPPDELNHAPAPGMNFGFPFRYGNNVPDPEFGGKDTTTTFTPCAQPLAAHVAALGVKFYTGKMFPPEYHDQIFIAEHGSWNRSKKSGYRIMLVTLKDNKPINYSVFAEGWLEPGDKVWGRPVDLCVMNDGSLLVSDDHAGAIYRISYSRP